MMKHVIEDLAFLATGGIVAYVCLMARHWTKTAKDLSFREAKRHASFHGNLAALETVEDVERCLRRIHGSCLAAAIIERVGNGKLEPGDIVPELKKIGADQSDLLGEAERLYQVHLRAKHGTLFE
jgi:hypothetical protein